ncbi:hypothetical protein FJ651_03130 [Paucihalobacter ruber]|uniref:Phosphate/sulfate permease n=1 Tax=Paucihalobacter ruber TaxID=2567861 RepID=A0A506PPX8_9FLAO|nr:hypothetical protein [Paucihalobacter ruber]TPV35926.1 hypothetical protein FJ651_03130 [Paucihalobacter ruber]
MKQQLPNRNRPYLNVLDYLVQEKVFLLIVILGIILSIVSVNFGQSAMWVGFFFAAYAAVSNDSIQSLGTFIESNKQRKWWILWLFTGGIFLAVVTFSWFYFNGDVTYQRLLDDDGVTKYPHPENFSFFQIIAPLVLIILTRLKMPVSTTFLLLSVFSADTSGISSIVVKSWSGYVMAFVLSFAIWYFSYNIIRKYFRSRKTHIAWTVVQWAVSGSLWAVWIMQDGANIAVFLPRQQTPFQFLIFAVTIFAGMGLLFFLRGDKIQEIVSEKVRISDVRAATLVDFSYVILLIYKLFISTVPMSTTWVFLGIIGGREIAVSLIRQKVGTRHKVKAVKMVAKDFSYAMIGLFISIALASGANKGVRSEIWNYITNIF